MKLYSERSLYCGRECTLSCFCVPGGYFHVLLLYSTGVCMLHLVGTFKKGPRDKGKRYTWHKISQDVCAPFFPPLLATAIDHRSRGAEVCKECWDTKPPHAATTTTMLSDLGRCFPTRAAHKGPPDYYGGPYVEVRIYRTCKRRYIYIYMFHCFFTRHVWA